MRNLLADLNYGGLLSLLLRAWRNLSSLFSRAGSNLKRDGDVANSAKTGPRFSAKLLSLGLAKTARVFAKYSYYCWIAVLPSFLPVNLHCVPAHLLRA